MYTRTEIGNLALSHLGDQMIDDIEERGLNAQALRRYYDHARMWTFERHAWRWAMRQAQLQQVPGDTLRYKHAYAKPPFYARLHVLSEYSNMEPPMLHFAEIGAAFVTDASSCYCEYVATDWDESSWKAYFADCVSLKLAALVAPKLHGNPNYNKALEEKLEKDVLLKARSLDGLNVPPRRATRSRWQHARFSGVR